MSRRTLPVRRLAVAALAPLALTTLAACGGDDADSTATDSAGAETSETPAADEGEEAGAEPVDAGAGDQIEPSEFMDVFEDAFEDATTVHMDMTMNTAAGAMTGEGDADYSTTPPSMELTMSGGMMPGDIEAIMIDGVMYMTIPGMGADGQYFKLDLSDPDNPLGSGLTSQLDPKAMFEQFEDSLTSVTYDGEKDVDGDASDAYTVTVDAADALQGQGQSMPPGMDLPKDFTYTVYFSDDRFRRMEIAMGESLGDVTMDFTDWGKDVSIEAPPADQVTDFPDLGTMMPSAGASS